MEGHLVRDIGGPILAADVEDHTLDLPAVVDVMLALARAAFGIAPQA